MTGSWHIVTKLIIVNWRSKVDYQNKVLPIYLYAQNNIYNDIVGETHTEYDLI